MSDPLLTILLVEDSPSDADLIEECLTTGGGFEVRITARLQEAIDYLQGGKPLDAILLDLGLPDSQGLLTLRTILQHKNEAPVIVLTGLDDLDQGVKAVRMGADDYLMKGTALYVGDLVRRAVLFAIKRRTVQAELRADAARERFEHQLEELETIDATEAEGAPLMRRSPEQFMELTRHYGRVLSARANLSHSDVDVPLSGIAWELGRLEAGPRDVVDIHRTALQAQTLEQTPEGTSALVDAGHVTGLSLMGMLLQYYRDHCRSEMP